MLQSLAGLIAGTLVGIAIRPLVDAYVLHRWIRQMRETDPAAMTQRDWRIDEIDVDTEATLRRERRAAHG